MREKFAWTEKYRPQTISECVLPEKIKQKFLSYVDNDRIPTLLLHGRCGVGKTTVAKALCQELNREYLFINGSDERNIDVLRVKVRNFCSTISITGKKKVVIFDEADYLTPVTQAALRGFIEEFEDSISFIFTCNYLAKIVKPLHSRCSVINFSIPKDEKTNILKGFVQSAAKILKQESVEFDSKVLVQVLKTHFPDFRRGIKELESYSHINKVIDEGILSRGTVGEIDELISILKSKKYLKMRDWVVDNKIKISTLFKELHEKFFDCLVPESYHNSAILLNEYEYRSSFVANQDINLMVCFAEIMQECTFK